MNECNTLSHQLLVLFQVCVQSCDQFQHHGTGYGWVTGTHKHLLWLTCIWRYQFRVIVTSQKQSSGSHRVQHSQDIRETNWATRGFRDERVHFNRPARRKRIQLRKDVLKPQNTELWWILTYLIGSEISFNLILNQTCLTLRTARLPRLPGCRWVRMGRSWKYHSLSQFTCEMSRFTWATVGLPGWWFSYKTLKMVNMWWQKHTESSKIYSLLQIYL